MFQATRYICGVITFQLFQGGRCSHRGKAILVLLVSVCQEDGAGQRLTGTGYVETGNVMTMYGMVFHCPFYMVAPRRTICVVVERGEVVRPRLCRVTIGVNTVARDYVTPPTVRLEGANQKWRLPSHARSVYLT